MPDKPTLRTTVEILRGDDGTPVPVEVLIDPDYPYSTLPRSFLERLGYKPQGHMDFSMSEEEERTPGPKIGEYTQTVRRRIISLPVGEVRIRLRPDDSARYHQFVFFPRDDIPSVIGNNSLSTAGLELDETGQHLVELTLYL